MRPGGGRAGRLGGRGGGLGGRQAEAGGRGRVGEAGEVGGGEAGQLLHGEKRDNKDLCNVLLSRWSRARRGQWRPWR